MQTPVIINLEKGFLTATFYQPENKPPPWQCVGFCHGFTGNRIEIRRLFVRFARRLNENGIAVFTFDYRGHGESSGDFDEFTMEDWRDDAKCALDYFLKRDDIIKDKISILGFSMGGCIASYLSVNPIVKRVLLWSPAAVPYHLFLLRLSQFSEKDKNDFETKKYVDFGGLKMTKRFVEVLKEIDPLKEIAKTKAEKIHIIQSVDDSILDFNENALRYEKALKDAKKSVTLLKIPNGGHIFSNLESEKMLFDSSLQFLNF